jgi:pyruvate kinase
MRRRTKISPRSARPARAPETIRELFAPAPTSSASTSATARHDDHARATRRSASVERSWPADRHPRRPAGTEAARRPLRRGGKVELKAGAGFRLDLDGTPGDARARRCRTRRSSRRSRAAPPAARRRQAAPARQDCTPDYAETGSSPAARCPTARASTCPASCCRSRRSPRRTARPGLRRSTSASTGWRCPSCSAPTTSPRRAKLIGGRAAVMAKIEKPAAIEYLDEIIALSDAVMVARGDLGVEMPPEDVPPHAEAIVRACPRRHPGGGGDPDAGIDDRAPAPTRAEASDVATAVYDGADAVMLSAETAAGKYPLEAVTIMDRIIRRPRRTRLPRHSARARRRARGDRRRRHLGRRPRSPRPCRPPPSSPTRCPDRRRCAPRASGPTRRSWCLTPSCARHGASHGLPGAPTAC